MKLKLLFNGLEFGVINISEQALKDLNYLIKKKVTELNCSIQNKHKNINDNKFTLQINDIKKFNNIPIK